jgi:hypothetical protein
MSAREHARHAGNTAGKRRYKDKGGAMEQVKTKSVKPHQRFTLPEVSWDERNETGA